MPAFAYEQRPVGPGKTFVDIAGWSNVLEQGKGSVFQFHDDALESLHSRLDFNQVEGYGLIRAEEPAGSDAEKKRVTDLAGGAGYGHADGGFVIHNWNYL